MKRSKNFYTFTSGTGLDHLRSLRRRQRGRRPLLRRLRAAHGEPVPRLHRTRPPSARFCHQSRHPLTAVTPAGTAGATSTSLGGQVRLGAGRGRAQARHHPVLRCSRLHRPDRGAGPGGGDAALRPDDRADVPGDRQSGRNGQPHEGDGVMALFGAPIASGPITPCAPTWPRATSWTGSPTAMAPSPCSASPTARW